MSDIKLFHRANGSVSEIKGTSAPVEKRLQELIEGHLETFFGVRFLATEYGTGKVHSGRIDSLGLDENNCPVIIEYKRRLDENVINQGLFYLDWLLDHRGEFQLLVQDKLGQEVAGKIDWAGPHLLCIASDFTKYDEHAVQQIGRSIELIRYRLFGDDLILLERVNSPATSPPPKTTSPKPVASFTPETSTCDVTVEPVQIVAIPDNLSELFEAFRGFVQGLGDDVEEKWLKLYVAYKKTKNFACVVPGKTKGILWLYLKLDPKQETLIDGFISDVSNKGHWATGDLEIKVQNEAELEQAKPLIEKSYENN